MPLLDHFRPPLRELRQWNSFHHAWATVIAFDFNERLPADYFAQSNVRFGIESDVAAFENAPAASAAPTWTPAAPTLTLPLTLLTDMAEVEIYRTVAGPELVGAIEFVSPANKDRPESRDAFVSKCASLVQQAIGLVVVDIVTERTADLHTALLRRLDGATPLPPAAPLWSASYRPWRDGGQTQLKVRYEPMALGTPLPTSPFWLKDGPCLQLDLDATYRRTCEGQRLRLPSG